jgi:spore maturation protein CgeB
VGKDFLMAQNGTEMKAHLKTVLDDPEYAKALASHGRKTVLRRHTCGHRVDQLLSICFKLKGAASRRARGLQRRRVTV